eukprot:gene26139-29528_t
MTRSDNLYLARSLFKINTVESLLDRDLINKLRHSLGRVTEIAAVKCSDYSLYKGRDINTLSVHITRLKTGVEQDVTLFMDRDEYLLCPIHSLATICVVGTCSTAVYPHITTKCEAQHVNRLFTRLSDAAADDPSPEAAELTPGLVSHSPRHGGTTEANESAFIQPSWLVARGGWTLGRIEQLFAYIAGTRKTDARIARILAGWEDPDYGGYGLTIECIPVADRDVFHCLLLHYEQVLLEFPHSKLIERMRSCNRMVPFSTVQGFITSTSNLLRETNANTCRMMERLSTIEHIQSQLMTSMTRIVHLLEANTNTLVNVPSNPVASSAVTPGPRSLMTDFVTVTP